MISEIANTFKRPALLNVCAFPLDFEKLPGFSLDVLRVEWSFLKDFGKAKLCDWLSILC